MGPFRITESRIGIASGERPLRISLPASVRSFCPAEDLISEGQSFIVGHVIRYNRLKMFAPVVVAKGYDEVASRIKELAREHDIVQVENIQLARALAKEVDIGKTAMSTDHVRARWTITLSQSLGW